MKISFELSDKDLRYFRKVLQKVRKGSSAGDEEVILREAQALLIEVKDTDAPEFIRNRIDQIELERVGCDRHGSHEIAPGLPHALDGRPNGGLGGAADVAEQRRHQQPLDHGALDGAPLAQITGSEVSLKRGNDSSYAVAAGLALRGL